jgi:polyisoprenoid-binding protein YceI
MSRAVAVLYVVAVVLLAGCSSATAPPAPAASGDRAAATPAPEAPAPEAPASEAPVAGEQIALTPDNVQIKFVGNHTGDDPKPRNGSFQQFTGTAVVDGGLKSVVVDIETASLVTEIDKLTAHLKNADFFDVNQFPQARFASTAIADLGDGKVEITGDLTLLGQTHQVVFPAEVSTAEGLRLQAEFVIDRTVWGMDYGLDQIEKEVPMTIAIGG